MWCGRRVGWEGGYEWSSLGPGPGLGLGLALYYY